MADPARVPGLARIAVITLVGLLVVGGAVVAGLLLLRSPGQTVDPPIAGSPGATAGPTAPSTGASGTSTSPGPARSLSAKNLLTVDDIPLEDYENQQAVVAEEGSGRPVPESSVCLPPNGLQDLGANQILHRDFRYDVLTGKPDRADPFAGRPVIYSQALQFSDAAAAAAARERYQGWLKACPAALTAKGYQLQPDLGFETTEITVEKGSATVTELAYGRPGGVDVENAIWESVGLTVVGDRMMITVFLHWGMDWELTIDATEGDLLHPQLGMCDAASVRLAQ